MFSLQRRIDKAVKFLAPGAKEEGVVYLRPSRLKIGPMLAVMTRINYNRANDELTKAKVRVESLEMELAAAEERLEYYHRSADELGESLDRAVSPLLDIMEGFKAIPCEKMAVIASRLDAMITEAKNTERGR